MNANPHTGELPAIRPAATGEALAREAPSPARLGRLGRVGRLGRLGRVGRLALTALRPHHAILAGILALSAVLTTYRLSQNGWANTFYSAGVASMLRSWHNFFFTSFDQGGLITIDKPPLGVWVQVASAKLFGLSPLSLLLPEAIAATLAVALLYRIVAKRLGPGAGLASAAALAVFPSFVAVSRDNGVDTVLILLMLGACGATLKAIEDGSWRWLIGAGVLVGLAFNTKTLAAYLVVPGLAAGYLLCASGPLWRRSVQLLAACAAMGVVSFSWIAAVELTPASSRPFVGGSTDNTELGLTFGYNGFGRVDGEVGGPGSIPKKAGAVVPESVLRSYRVQEAILQRRWGLRPRPAPVVHRHIRVSRYLPNGRLRNPIPFGKAPGPLRLFGKGLGQQGGWLLPLAAFGLLAAALQLGGPWRRRKAIPGTQGAGSDGERASAQPSSLDGQAWRRDPRLAVGLVLGGWFATEAAVLSLSKGIVHPYYVSALAPGAGAAIGMGALAFTDFARRSDLRLLLLPVAVLATVGVEVVLLHREHYMHWFVPYLAAGAALGVCVIAVKRLALPAMALTLALLLAAPAAFSATTWLAPVEGTFAAAGPQEATGEGLYGLSRHAEAEYRSLARYVSSHHPGSRWAILTDASPTAAPFILMGLNAGAVGGYSGTDPTLDGRRLASMVARHEARYVLIGGPYSSRGGNLSTRAVLRACSIVRPALWHGPDPTPHAYVLFDCAGAERALAAEQGS